MRDDPMAGLAFERRHRHFEAHFTGLHASGFGDREQRRHESVVSKFDGREIDRDLVGDNALCSPGMPLIESLYRDVQADLDEIAAALGAAQELVRTLHAIAPIPAQQGFDADEALLDRVDPRMKQQQELIVFERIAELDFDVGRALGLSTSCAS